MALGLVDAWFEGVTCLEREVDDGSVDDQAMLAGEVEEGFEDVGESIDRDEVEETGATLERMKCSEDSVEGFGVFGLSFEDQDPLLDIVEVFAGFGDELAQQFAVVFDIEDDGKAGFVLDGILRLDGGW